MQMILEIGLLLGGVLLGKGRGAAAQVVGDVIVGEQGVIPDDLCIHPFGHFLIEHA